MKKLILLAFILMTGCASQVKQEAPPPKVYPLLNFKGVEAMDNNEVVQQSKQCIYAKMHPNINYLSVHTEQGKVLVPVGVYCEPIL